MSSQLSAGGAADRLITCCRIGRRYRAAPKRAGIRSVGEYRRATPAQVCALGPYAPLLRRILRTARPNVLAGLFDPPDWHVAVALTHPSDRLLVIEGYDVVVYRADDAVAERVAWASIGASGR